MKRQIPHIFGRASKKAEFISVRFINLYQERIAKRGITFI